MRQSVGLMVVSCALFSLNAYGQDDNPPRVFKANKAPAKFVTKYIEKPVPVPVPSGNQSINWGLVNDIKKGNVDVSAAECDIDTKSLSENEAAAKKIACNNKKVTQRVNPHNFNNAIQTYPYQRGMVYQIITAVGGTTDIEFLPGEVPQDAQIGNPNLYNVSTAKSGSEDNPVYHIILKPTYENTVTDLKIYTNYRTYFLELISMPYGEGYLSGVNWSGGRGLDNSIPLNFAGSRSSQTRKVVKTDEKPVGFSFDPGSANFGYQVKLEEGRKPEWMPTRVIDNGRETYIEFPSGITNIPAIYVETAEGKGITPQFRPHANGVVVSQLAEVIVLRSGAEEDDNLKIIKIINRNYHG